MSRNFHNLHARVASAEDRDAVVEAVVAHLQREGFERVPRASQADRVVRMGISKEWISLEDDGWEIGAIARAVAKQVPLSLLEAGCEASAVVSLSLYVDGKHRGGWGEGRLPAKRWVEPLLREGNAAELAAAWELGAQQVFPETALAEAAKRFGLPVERMFGDDMARMRSLYFRRANQRWKPEWNTDAPSFEVLAGGNGQLGGKHLAFEGLATSVRVLVRSTGGPSTGLIVRVAGSAIERGLLEVVDISQTDSKLVRMDDAWHDAHAKLGATLRNEPNLWELARKERERIQALTQDCERYVHVEMRARERGEGDLRVTIESGGARAEDVVEVAVMWRPWRPRSADATIHDDALFEMHRAEHLQAHITLRGDLRTKWEWARPHIEAWAKAHGETALRVIRDEEVILRESLDEYADEPQPPLSWAEVANLLPEGDVAFQVAGRHFLFGTFSYPSNDRDRSDPLMHQLVLGAGTGDRETELLAQASAIADDAFMHERAHSALVALHRSAPSERTAWENITGSSSNAALAQESWHERHVRGVDKRMWISHEHATRIDRAELARHATVTEVGSGLRLTVADSTPRRQLEPLEIALSSLLPT